MGLRNCPVETICWFDVLPLSLAIMPPKLQATGTAMNIEAIREDFAFLDDWEDRYRYVIELGKALPPLDDALRCDANKVAGCVSQVWLATHIDKSLIDDVPMLSFSGDSDAMIVRGLVAILIALYNNKTTQEIAAIDAPAILNELGLSEHLTPQRSNGLASMVARIRSDAARITA